MLTFPISVPFLSCLWVVKDGNSVVEFLVDIHLSGGSVNLETIGRGGPVCCLYSLCPNGQADFLSSPHIFVSKMQRKYLEICKQCNKIGKKIVFKSLNP